MLTTGFVQGKRCFLGLAGLARKIRFVVFVLVLLQWSHDNKSRLVLGLTTKLKTVPRRFRNEMMLPPLERISNHPFAESENDQKYFEPLEALYTNDLPSAEQWIEEHITRAGGSDDPRYTTTLGWDMESTPNLPWRQGKYTHDSYFGPATLQLSTVDSALVFRIAQDGFGPIHEGGLPKVFHRLLEDPSVIPVGIGIDLDLVELYRWCLEHGDDCAGPAWASAIVDATCRRFDLGGVGVSADSERQGMARLSELVLGVVLPKSKRLSVTHWSKTKLSEDEIAYAARDAWAGAAVVDRLERLDPDRFGPSAISQTLEEQLPGSGNDERPLLAISKVSNRMLLRKSCKDEIKAMEQEQKEACLPAAAENLRITELKEQFWALRPTPPIRYEIESLKLPSSR